MNEYNPIKKIRSSIIK